MHAEPRKRGDIASEALSMGRLCQIMDADIGSKTGVDMAKWTEDRLHLVRQKKLLADALSESMSLSVGLADGHTIEGRVVSETLEGEIASGGRLAYRATVTLYSRPKGFIELDLLDIQSFRTISEVPN